MDSTQSDALPQSPASAGEVERLATALEEKACFLNADCDCGKCQQCSDGIMIARASSALRALTPPAQSAEPTDEEIAAEHLAARAKMIAEYPGPIVSFEVRDPYYLASCDACGWVGSSEHCGTDSGFDDSDVYCPRCHASGADCGKVANTLTPPAQSGDGEASPRPWRVVPYGDGDSLVIHDARGNYRVCFMSTPGGGPGAWDRIKANAALIVSAVNGAHISDAVSFGASEAAGYLYPGEDQQAERDAFCAGAAYIITPDTSKEGADVREGRYVICKGGAYYRPNAEGYTRKRSEAGLFTIDEAVFHSHPNGPRGPRDGITYEPALRASQPPEQAGMASERHALPFGTPPEPVANPSADWVERYAAWYEGAR